MANLLSGTWLLDGPALLAELAVHWLAQSTIVIAVGIAAGMLLRHRGPALQSAIYRTTLLAAIACPLAGWLLSTVGLTFATLEIPSLRISP